MLQALLKGKLSPEQETIEDVLTSNVFGLLKYLPPTQGLIPFLARAVSFDGETRPFADLVGNPDVSYEFWPWLEFPGCLGCEPDVLLRIGHEGGSKQTILIEAKFMSGKSSLADEVDARPTDQLAREWDNLTYLAEEEGAEPLLLYVTSDFGIPFEEIRASAAEYEAKRPARAARFPFAAAWLSWRHLPGTFRNTSNEMLKDLVGLAERLGLVFFCGIRTIKPIPGGSWRFLRRFEWERSASPLIEWSFEQ
jgi:hypothetical protein